LLIGGKFTRQAGCIAPMSGYMAEFISTFLVGGRVKHS